MLVYIKGKSASYINLISALDVHLTLNSFIALIMNKITPKKLLNSKWTAVTPVNKEKHFIIIEMDFDEEGVVISCVIEAVMSKRQVAINWQDLKDQQRWLQGWQ